MAYDPTATSHQEWLGYVQPVGVVVSTSALLEAGAAIDRNFVPLHRQFLAILPQDCNEDPIPQLTDFPKFTTEVLGWRPEDLSLPDESLTVSLPGYEETLHPEFVVKDGGTTLLLITRVASDFDQAPPPEPRKWNAAPQLRFERLLRETATPAGLLVSPNAIRLVYAPKGESSGHITFRISDMASVQGRPILAALHMLLSANRLFTAGPGQTLAHLLKASREHQNLVSTKLSGQVMEALFDLLRGFQSAHDQTGVLTQILRDNPNQVYAGLLTVLLRLVFTLYAEDRGLLSPDKTYTDYYSVNGLFKQLREDAAHHPDTMDQRFGAWARLLSLFRLIYRGAAHGPLRIPGRKGYLFDPDRYPFLEGRENPNPSEISNTAPTATPPIATPQTPPEIYRTQVAPAHGRFLETPTIQLPRVPDGVLYRVLTRLLILEGERLSYRNLDVEQIGSVYEAMMGFELHVAAGPSIALKPKKRGGAPLTINLAELLTIPAAKRNEWLNKNADQKVTGASERALKDATSPSDLIAALDRRIAKNVTPTVVPTGAMIFQPSAERRRSGSHYTPRSLTQPIVEAALAPVLQQLGERPRPHQILSLKICDPAMGSGAFLVEACRQMGAALVTAWHNHDEAPPLPPDEDELLHARRIVAQRCLYGVDKNEMATDLAKLSLWLTTLARDHEFTFLNHALRHGDSLVGLTAEQIAAFDWDPKLGLSFLEQELRERIVRVSQYRKRILDAREDTPYEQLSQEMALAEQELQLGRMAGDLVVNAFFEADKKASRTNARRKYEVELKEYLEGDLEKGVALDGVCSAMLHNEKPLIPFHWQIEFPEVFDLDDHLKARAGFDLMVGNPPFMGGQFITGTFGTSYLDWLKEVHPLSHGNADLAAHFFRRSYQLLREDGCFGLVATNTIRQGDTRSTGLRWICVNGGTIYGAKKRVVWPGPASVVVCTIHIRKGNVAGPFMLDNRAVKQITAFLFYAHGHEDPARLGSNVEKAFCGVKITGSGFTFDDSEYGRKRGASPTSDMRKLLDHNSLNRERIFPYLGGDEVNNEPNHAFHRFVINFEDFPLEKAETGTSWFALTEAERRRQLQIGVVAADYPFAVASQ